MPRLLIGTILSLLLSLSFMGVPATYAADAEQQLRDGDVRNLTTMTFDDGHGTQVEYLAADGRSYLWYPGNKVVLDGRYKFDQTTLPIDKRPNSPKVTLWTLGFKYGPNTYNPQTGSRGGQWECNLFSLYVLRAVGVVRGDVFGLSRRGQVPFVLGRERATIDRSLAKCRDCPVQ